MLAESGLQRAFPLQKSSDLPKIAPRFYVLSNHLFRRLAYARCNPPLPPPRSKPGAVRGTNKPGGFVAVSRDAWRLRAGGARLDRPGAKAIRGGYPPG